MANNNTLEEYNEEMQKVLVSFLISDPNSFALTQTIVKPEYFDSGLKKAVTYIMEYANEWRGLPTPEQIKASTNVTVERFSDVQPAHGDWFCDKMEKFCRFKALELVILDGVDMLARGEGAEVERRTREAMTISLVKDLGTSYYEDAKSRLERLKDRSNFITTGWATLDAKLYGGFTPGSLNVFAGGSGAGKSLFLQNIARNWALLGMNVVYFSLELSEDLVSMRIDSMSSHISTKDILKRINEVSIAVQQGGRGAGDLIIKKMPEAGTTSNDLRAFLKEYEIQRGKKFDAIVVDYLDLMHPNNGKVNPSDLFVKDKYVSEELRSIAGELGIPLVTASQLNRQSVEAAEFDHSHIAGGISKINTADNVFGIFTSATMRESGKYQIQFLKTRSSSAVGGKLELKFDPTTLIISDMEDNGQTALAPQSSSQLRAAIQSKTTSTFENGGETIDSNTGEVLRQSMLELIAKNRPNGNV
jgi:archaellum biogenesis ATPase FlaH